AVEKAHAVAGMPVRQARARQRVVRAVVHAHGDVPALGGVMLLLDFLAGKRAAGSAEHGHDRPAGAVAELVADHCAGNPTSDRADARASIARRGHFLHGFDRAEDAGGYGRLRRLRNGGAWRGLDWVRRLWLRRAMRW